MSRIDWRDEELEFILQCVNSKNEEFVDEGHEQPRISWINIYKAGQKRGYFDDKTKRQVKGKYLDQRGRKGRWIVAKTSARKRAALAGATRRSSPVPPNRVSHVAAATAATNDTDEYEDSDSGGYEASLHLDTDSSNGDQDDGGGKKRSVKHRLCTELSGMTMEPVTSHSTFKQEELILSQGSVEAMNDNESVNPLLEPSQSNAGNVDLEDNAQEHLQQQPPAQTKKFWRGIVNVLERGENEGHVLEALKTIGQACNERKTRASITRAGGLHAIIRAMRRYEFVANIQIAACVAVQKLALDPQNAVDLEQIGGVKVVLKAMRLHFGNGAVQCRAWSTLGKLTCLDSLDKELTVDAPGVMASLIAGLRSHVEDPDVVTNACLALKKMCLDDRDRLQALIDADGFVVVAMALQKHFWNPSVRKEVEFMYHWLLRPQLEATE